MLEIVIGENLSICLPIRKAKRLRRLHTRHFKYYNAHSPAFSFISSLTGTRT